MKIQSIPNFKYPSISTKSKVKQPLQNNNSLQAVSFGLVPPVPPAPVDPLTALAALAFALLQMTGIAIAKGKYAENKSKNKQLKYCQQEFRELIEQDLNKYAKSNNLTLHEAQKRYIKRLKKAMYPNDYIDGNLGINSVKGHEVERFKLLLNVIIPVIEARKSNTSELLPHGVLLNGKDSELNNKLIKALARHLEPLEVQKFEWDINNFDTQQAIRNIDVMSWTYNETGKYSLVHIKNADNIEKTKDFDLLKNVMENSLKLGAIFVYDATDIKNIPTELLRPGRTDIIIDVK